jgi:hypothetical protein
MIIFDAVVNSKILVLIILIWEGKMVSMKREQGNHMVRGIKMPLHLFRGKRDFMDYQDLNSQVIQNEKYFYL